MCGEKVVAAEMYTPTRDRFYGQWLVLNVPFDKITDLFPDAVTSKVPDHLKYLACALKCPHAEARATFGDPRKEQGSLFPGKFENELRMYGRTKSYIETVVAMIEANRAIIDLYLQEKLSLFEDAEGRLEGEGGGSRGGQAGAPGNPEPSYAGGQAGGARIKFNDEQVRVVGRVKEAIDRSKAIEREESSVGLARLLEECRKQKAVICTGAPGTGKSTAAFECINYAIAGGGRVLLALPTAQLGSRMREIFSGQRSVAIDTCAAAFSLLNDAVTEAPTLSGYNLIVVDEISQLDQMAFERIYKLWQFVDKEPALLFLGDKFQMCGFGDERPWASALWRRGCFRVDLFEAFRCKDPEFWKLLMAIRRAKPDDDVFRALTEGRRAWKQKYPTPEELRKLMDQHPDTTIMTCTRKGAASLNDLATRVLFPRKKPLVTLDADIESNPDNYGSDRRLKPAAELQPRRLKIFRGMKVYLTQNLCKEADFVNGMSATVERFDRTSQSLLVLTATGRRLMVYRWTNPRESSVKAHYPIRAGYASTIMKFQGATLPHVTVFLDCPNVPGAAYTALSRVSLRKNYALGGYLTVDHFTPVSA